MSQPPNQHNNPYGGPPHPHGGYNNPRPMGAWQPAAPTSLQVAAQGQQQQPNPAQQYGQQQPVRTGAYTVPPPQMNPYAYHNPYAQQYPQPRVGGWNPAYGGNMYGAPNPAMYYQPPGPGGPPGQQPPVQPVPQAAAAAAAVPAPRPKKALVITVRSRGNDSPFSSSLLFLTMILAGFFSFFSIG